MLRADGDEKAAIELAVSHAIAAQLDGMFPVNHITSAKHRPAAGEILAPLRSRWPALLR